MLIKITKSCNNGCIHCLNDSKPCNEHMSLETFKDVLTFTRKYEKSFLGNIITGGEPTEHPQFEKFIHTYYSFYSSNQLCTVATNGHWIIQNQDKTKELCKMYPGLHFQVTYDSRYYPVKLDTTKRILKHNQIVLCETVDHIYPQGRAVSNNIPKSNNITAPKCTNLKLLAAQIGNKGLIEIINTLREYQKYCTPAIHINGQIGFGESDLCLLQCSIYNDEKTIIEKNVI